MPFSLAHHAMPQRVSFLHRPVSKWSGSCWKPWPPETFCLVPVPTSDLRVHQTSVNSERPMFPPNDRKTSWVLLEGLPDTNILLEYLHVPILFTILTFILIMGLYQVSFRACYCAPGSYPLKLWHQNKMWLWCSRWYPEMENLKNETTPVTTPTHHSSTRTLPSPASPNRHDRQHG